MDQKKKIEGPHADDFVGIPELGSPEFHRNEIVHGFKKLFEKGGEPIGDYEVEKTQEEEQLIEFAQKLANQYLHDLGRVKEINLPLENIHILKPGGTNEFTQEKFEGGSHNSRNGAIIVDRMANPALFITVLFHELIHAKSWKVFQITKNDGFSVEMYRSGLEVVDRSGKKYYFSDLEEAVTAYLENKFFNEHIANNPRFKPADVQEVTLSRPDELGFLYSVADEITSKLPNEFKTRDEVISLFVDAHINGRLLPLAKTIEKIYGKGSFRELGELTQQIKS